MPTTGPAGAAQFEQSGGMSDETPDPPFQEGDYVYATGGDEGEAHSEQACIWFGTGAALRTVAWLAALCLAAAAVVLVAFDTRKPWGNRLGGAVFAWLGVVASYVCGIRPGVELCPDEVTVRRFFSSVTFPTSELSHANGSSLLLLHRKDGAALRVVAVATNNVTLMLGRKGRAQRVAQIVNTRLSAARSARVESSVPRREGFNWRIAVVILAAAVVQVSLLFIRLALE